MNKNLLTRNEYLLLSFFLRISFQIVVLNRDSLSVRRKTNISKSGFFDGFMSPIINAASGTRKIFVVGKKLLANSYDSRERTKKDKSEALENSWLSSLASALFL